MRRRIITIVIATLVVVGLCSAVMATSSGSDITRARLERSLPVTFANIYADQARLLGRPDITPASLHAQAMCDKGGVTEPDAGPGATWVCLMSWKDPNVPMPSEGYGKFELNVHSNGCYTAGSPSKLAGFATLTDTSGQTVTNPAFEFDGCFDLHGDNAPTGVSFPSVLGVLSTDLTTDAQGKPTLQLSCGTGDKGCSGTVSATAGSVDLGTVSLGLQEETTSTVTLPRALPAGVKDVSFTVRSTDSVGPSSPVTLTATS